MNPEAISYLRSRCRVYPFWVRGEARKRVRTVFPWILMPDYFFGDPHNPWWNPILAHESVHLEQQSQGPTWVPVSLRLLWFLGRYVIKSQRLHYEAAGIAAEIDMAPISRKQGIYDSYLSGLVGADYSGAAKDEAEAAAAIRLALILRDCPWTPEAA